MAISYETCNAYNSVPYVCNDGGGLPFTGFDVIVIVAVALGLIALGYLIRKASRDE